MITVFVLCECGFTEFDDLIFTDYIREEEEFHSFICDSCWDNAVILGAMENNLRSMS
jgi:hypothetical protein